MCHHHIYYNPNIGILQVKILHSKKTVDIIYSLTHSVREKIRTPDTLVRSQVLYPAELRTHNI